MQKSESQSVFLTGVTLYYVQCNPARATNRFNPDRPQWSLSIRTTDPKKAEEYKAKGLVPKFVIPEGKTPAEGYYSLRFQKNAKKADGSPARPVEVVTGTMRPLDPDTIGNGSIGNLRLLARDGERQGKPAKLFTLMGLQVTHLVPYEGAQHDGFTEAEFSVEESDNAFTGQKVAEEDDPF